MLTTFSLATRPGDRGDGCLPAIPAKRTEHPGDQAAKASHEAVFEHFHGRKAAIFNSEAKQSPNDDAGKQDDRTGFFDKAPAALPC